MSFDVRLHAQQLLRAYLAHFPAEHGRFDRLRRQLDDADDLSVRSNMTGHLTSSAAVLDAKGAQVLLIHHAFLDKWLTPGGHYEGPGDLLASALREVAEETGVRDARPHPWTLRTGIPLDIDSHDIPANPKKREGAHVHHDFLFLAMASGQRPLQAQLDEVHAAVWAPVDELGRSDDERVRRVHAKLQRMALQAAFSQGGAHTGVQE